MSIVEEKKTMSRKDTTEAQQVEYLKEQLEELQRKYDEVLKSGMNHCQQRMDLESLVEKYKKFKVQDQKLAEDLEKQVADKTFVIDAKNSRINELSKALDSEKLKTEELLHIKNSKIIEESSRPGNWLDQQLREQVKEHIDDLRRHNKFLEKHFEGLLVS